MLFRSLVVLGSLAALPASAQPEDEARLHFRVLVKVHCRNICDVFVVFVFLFSHSPEIPEDLCQQTLRDEADREDETASKVVEVKSEVELFAITRLCVDMVTENKVVDHHKYGDG